MMSSWYLLFSSVDYAGLFPPAKLDMKVAVENFHAYLNRPIKPMLGKLVVPASRLDEFSELAAPFLPRESANDRPANSHWLISGLVPPPDPADPAAFEEAINTIRRFNKHHHVASNGLATVSKIEVKTPTAAHIDRLADHHVEMPDAYLEVPLSEQTDALIEKIASRKTPDQRNLRAKIRTGGLTPDLIPTTRQVAEFIYSCAQHKVEFKATAGLHHPLRNSYRLTYEPDSASATMHGFVNVFVASVVACSTSASVDQLEEILAIDQAAEFKFSETGIKVKGFDLSNDQILQSRFQGINSFGSCSYEEPSDEFESLFGAIERPSDRPAGVPSDA